MYLDHIPGGARRRRNNGRVASRQQVEKTRLSGVGRTNDGQMDAVAQALAPVIVGQVGVDLSGQIGNVAAGFGGNPVRQVFIGEIDFRFHMGQGVEQPLAPIFVEIAQATLHLAQGLVALGLGLGIDQVGQALGFRQVQFAGLKGAPGKLPRFRQPQAGARPQSFKSSGNDGAAPMQVKFGDVFAGKAGRARKPQHQTAINGRTVGGLYVGHGRPARLRQVTAGHRRQGRPGRRAGNPDDGKPGRAGAGRGGKNGFGGHY